ncbi:MAG TPA: anti-sigma factor [Terriglobales bacterium]|nr:anti-sigma factor [Terriglobales bacterium]
MAEHAQRDLLHAYIDDELDLVRSMELEDHLTECADCVQQVESYRALREAITSELRYKAPADLRSRILNQVQDADRPESIRSVSRVVPRWSWAALAACLVLAAAALTLDIVHRQQQTLARAIVNDHVRSLMANHLTDVLTSDQHTVKPWFTGKLDFSPSVQDLSPEGFELIGGRLEYLDDHRAAAIVYQRRKHVINVFTWVSSDSDEAPRVTSQQGFNLVEWKHGGMYYCAVSDLNRQELEEFVSLLRR